MDSPGPFFGGKRFKATSPSVSGRMSDEMSVAYDAGLERMETLASAIDASHRERNEAATRLHLIDRLLFDCLGWSRDDADIEDEEQRTFADYVLDRHRRRLVVEAKREGISFELPLGLGSVCALRALLKLGGEIESALTQVENYAHERGIPYAAICNGWQLVAFVAVRQDGVPPH